MRRFLDVVSTAVEKPMLVCDGAGAVVWQSATCAEFESHLRAGGAIASLIRASRVPGRGEVLGELLIDGCRVVRWTARQLPRKLSLWAKKGPQRAVLWVLEDLTNLRRSQRLLEDSEGRWRLLSAHAKGILFELDAQARFVRVWASDPGLLARPAEELPGHTIPEILGDDQGQRHHRAVLDTLESGRSVRYEYVLPVPGGRRHFACESVAVSAIDTSVRHAVFWIRDITEQVRIRNRLVETERLASLGVLAAGIAHEINNPLGYLMLNAERLRTTLGRPYAHEGLGTQLAEMRLSANLIYEGGKQVQGIVQDLLQLAKPSGQVEPVDLRQAVGMSVELTRPLWQGRARLTTKYEEVPPVLAHHGCLVQTFVNLVKNATEAMLTCTARDNLIQVSVRSLDSKTVQVEVRDTGNGISEEDAPRIFDPFFTTKAHGTGLGLAICQIIINAFSGEIRFERAPDRGSIFRVLLPTMGEETNRHQGAAPHDSQSSIPHNLPEDEDK